MKKVMFVVTFDDVEIDVQEAGLSDLVAFEKQFGLPASHLEPEIEDKTDKDGNVVMVPKLDEETDEPVLDAEGQPVLVAAQVIVSEFRLEWICFLLWRALRRQNVIEKTVEFDDDFIDRITNIDKPGSVKEVTEDAAPLDVAPSLD